MMADRYETHRVFDYDTGEMLPEFPTNELIRESFTEQSSTGAVLAYMDHGIWHLTHDTSRKDVRTVFVDVIYSDRPVSP